jgi:uncharacterized hydrophobic protein (TIGR00271 family)
MGPINGMGYSLATYNFPLFRQSLKNFSFAVIASLLSSTAYFAISPVSTAHSELLARTSPTIYDVLIALFGGLAGILAISSKLKGNVIPGVAIATALMPPLCTAGYGIATAQISYFLGALYLFTINTVFIAISSVFMSQVLRFPIRIFVDNVQKNRVKRWITFIITITVIPSIYFGYRLVEKERFTENANRFIQTVGIVEGNILLRSEINSDKRVIKLVYAGKKLTDSHKRLIRSRADMFSLQKTELDFEQGFSFAEIFSVDGRDDRLKAERDSLLMALTLKDRMTEVLPDHNQQGRQILSELRSLYPQVISLSYDNTVRYFENEGEDSIMLVVIGTDSKVLYTRDRVKIRNWLEQRLQTDSLQVFFEEGRLYANQKAFPK